MKKILPAALRTVAFSLWLPALAALAGCSIAAGATDDCDSQVVAANLKRFDTLDFEAFNKQDWPLFDKIHCADVVVNFPDGHQTTGIVQHEKDMKAMFAYMPDMGVSAHPLMLGSGEWTAATGVFGGTFTQPMQIGPDQFIQPTGKHFRIQMATMAKWRGECIAEETLFWDGGEFAKQLGLQ